MAQWVYALPVVACPVGMAVMMWFMMRGGKHRDSAPSVGGAVREEMATLRAEIDQLRAAQRQPQEASVPPLTGREVLVRVQRTDPRPRSLPRSCRDEPAAGTPYWRLR